ncbi:Sec1-like protein [Pavlovales sp. CCMP2436]|nr:Sec1-like protein [Pavlovales sp. CCMP2436]
MRGLREQTRARLLEVFKSLNLHEPGAVLLCDKLALRTVSSACKVSDIMEEGITLVESLDIQRQPLREFAAVYLVTPTVAAVNMMLEDYANPRAPMYGDVHVLFTSHLPDALMNKIKVSPLVQRIKTFRELNLEFLAIESGAFTLDAPEAMSNIFSPSSTTSVPEQHRIASQLATLFATYGEMPYIRFAAKGHPSSSSLAYIVQDKLEMLAQGGAFANQRSRSERPTLLVVDRTIDPLAPLLHEYSYQARWRHLLACRVRLSE